MKKNLINFGGFKKKIFVYLTTHNLDVAKVLVNEFIILKFIFLSDFDI